MMPRGESIEGVCWLCGRFGKLTREHIPPRAAFNDNSVLAGGPGFIFELGMPQSSGFEGWGF